MLTMDSYRDAAGKEAHRLLLDVKVTCHYAQRSIPLHACECEVEVIHFCLH